MLQSCFSESHVEQLARILGAMDGGFTGSEITRIFAASGVKDTSNESTKWKRIYYSLVNAQARSGNGSVVIAFVQTCMDPARYVNLLHVFEDRRARVNEVLAFAGCSVREDGKVWKSVAARTLDEAAQMAERITGELRRRNVHPMLMQFCERELLQKDLFHGVHEGTKSLFERIRQATGEYADGTDLIDTCFADRNGLPIIAINNYETETEKSEHRGFANLLRGVFGTWRNPTAHSLRLGSELAEQDVLDALTMLSYLHHRLDSAVNTNNGRSL